MQIYFLSRLCSYLPRVPKLVDGTLCPIVAVPLLFKGTFMRGKFVFGKDLFACECLVKQVCLLGRSGKLD